KNKLSSVMNSVEDQIIIFKPEVTNSLSASVLKTLLYYDLFNYPLTASEVVTHCRMKHCNLTTIQDALEELCNEQLVFRSNQFYSVQDNEEIFSRRIKGNEAAAAVMKKVYERSKLVAAFPFVRGVFISGSLSKNYFDDTT